ncbi:MAG: redox-sensing transcriptional repressor Rex [Oscillospiraceae bacterium]|nr:redox-sensing transcriptional repressor Rex [Oscillospiraceae bacterium]
MKKQISKRTLYRLPIYLSLLQEKAKEGVEYISATTIANLLDLNHVQVRKDLSCASSAGRPKVGYETNVLISDLQEFLDYNNTKNAIIVGAGDLGKALLGYNGFTSYGLNVVAAFDSDENLCGTNVKGKPIYHISQMEEVINSLDVHIGIITTPAKFAQRTCDNLVKFGVKGIWNFAPTSLTVPKGVIVQNENMATSLAVLSNKLNEELNK